MQRSRNTIVLDDRINKISSIVVDSALDVHRRLGPGLLESAYEACLKYELRQRGIQVESQVARPVVYKTRKIDIGYRLDLLVENCIVVEIKSVKELTRVHEAQLLSYLKLGGYKVGLLLNFNVLRIKDGLKRLVHDL